MAFNGFYRDISFRCVGVTLTHGIFGSRYTLISCHDYHGHWAFRTKSMSVMSHTDDC